MKVKEVTYRDCCQYDDFKPAINAKKGRFGVYEKVYCKYCGAKWEFYTFTDVAGSTDWDYRRIDKER